ncbi:MAG: hypothetical protein D6795_01710 [Deltaproteobacteria bacterium]|nr:MAG: hypothetical protein D6795_01710 [Deltaproteobacteria bacterium]
MRRIPRFPALFGALALSLFLAGGGNAQIRVAVEQGLWSSGSAESVVAQLNDSEVFDFEAVQVYGEEINTLDELNAFDVVVIGDSGTKDNDHATFAAPLAQWVEQGGNVVSTAWIVYSTNGTGQVALDIDKVVPMKTTAPYIFTRTETVSILDDTHPITQGISDYDLTGGSGSDPCCLESSSAGADDDAAVLATWGPPNEPHPLVAVGEYGLGNIVYLGHVYMASSGYDVGDLRSGEPDRLLEQAVAYAGCTDGDDDGICDIFDNCPEDANEDQSDRDLDGIGDVCDCAPDDNTQPDENGNCAGCGVPMPATTAGTSGKGSLPAAFFLLLLPIAGMLLSRRSA